MGTREHAPDSHAMPADRTRALTAALSSWLENERTWVGIVAVASLVIAVPRYLMQVAYGPGWDAYTFLLNALEYAGQGEQYMEIYRPPLLPFLVSLFNRVGIDAAWPSFFVDGVFTVAGVIGLFLLLRFSLSRPVSAIAAIAFLTLPDTVENLTAGITDLMSVAVSIWLVYFTVRALRDDPAWLRWAILMVPLAFMTRFTGGMMLAVIMFALVYDGHPSRYFRAIGQGMKYSAALLVPYFAYHWLRFGDPFIQIWEPFRAVTATSRVGMLAGAIEPSSYFVLNAPGFLSAATVYGLALIALMLVGLLMAGVGVIERRREGLSTRRVVVLGVASAALVPLIVGPTSFLPVLIGWIVLLGVLVPRWLAREDDAETQFIVIMLFWFVLYLSIHSHMLVKVTRYYLTMAPAAVFFLAYPLEHARQRLRAAGASGSVGFAAACLALIAVLGVSAQASFARLDTLGMQDFSGYEAAATWLDEHAEEPGARITSDAYPHFRYQTRRAIWPMGPIESKGAMEHWLDTNGFDYFVSIHDWGEIDDFELALAQDDVRIYQRVRPAEDRTDVLLVGRSVNRHLDDVFGANGPYIHAHTRMIPDDYSGTEGTYVDEFTPAQLAEYDAVYLYDFRWHDRADAEAVLREFVTAGGTIVIDATANLGSPPGTPNGLEGTTFLDVFVWRTEFPDAQTVAIVDPALDSGNSSPEFGPFRSEDRATWIAAGYTPLEGTPVETLATYGAQPIVTEQPIGDGRVIWLAGNLGFHAFLHGTDAEDAFLRKVIDYAAEPPGQTTATTQNERS